MLPDHKIEALALDGMIKPFDRKQLSSYGYDATLSNEFLIPKTNFNKQAIVDPLASGTMEYEPFNGSVCLIPPHGFVLGRTKEYFMIPRNILVLCVGRSSYARCGIITNVT